MKRKVFYIVVVMFLYLFLETSLRLVLCITAGTSFFRPSDVIYKYYPELIPIQHASISNTDSTLDVLILSCSVLHKDWADIVSEMNSCVQLPAGYNKIKIYNASGIGHGSRDNLIKYTLLAGKKFDAIIYYDAINDARLNNCPADVFKSDYSHYQWYDEINHIISHKEMDYTVLPFFYDWVRIRLRAIFRPQAYIPKHFVLRPDWLAFGKNFMSVESYETNLKKIIELSQQRKARFLYLSFAYYLPANYSLEAFQNKSLDYTFCDHSRETEIWGLPQNVGRFIDTINTESKIWTSPYNNVRWVDLYSAFPKEGIYFADICHFSPRGIHQFASAACKQLDTTVMTIGN
jgi:hypothetical protein